MARKQKAPLTSLRNKPSASRKQPGLARLAKGGRVNFETGGLKYPDYGSTTTAPLKVTAERPSQEEMDAYFATHDENGNLIQHEYNKPYEYSIPRLGAAGIEALASLGSMIPAYLGGSAYGIGANLASGKFGTKEGVRIADEAAAKAAQAMTYQPRLKAGQEAMEGIGSLLEASKIPPIGIPELAGIQGMRRFTPDDLSVVHGRTKQYVGDPVTDYYNAQSGITKDYPTLGATVQRKAQPIVNVASKAAENLSAPSTLNKQTGAIFVEGAPKRNVNKKVDLQGRAHPDTDTFPRFEGVHSVKPHLKIAKYIEELPPALGLDQRGVKAAWDEFKRTKAHEMYPDAPEQADAVRAFDAAFEGDEKRDILHSWLDEFSKTNALGMPDLDVLKVREDKAITALEKTYPDMVAKYVGQAGADQLVDLASHDLILTDNPEVLRGTFNTLMPAHKAHLAKIREAAGLPVEGLKQQEIDKINADITNVDQQLADLTRTKWDMEEQWTDRDTQPPPEGYKELTRKETKLTDEKKRLQKHAKAMENAPAVEGLHDLAVSYSTTPSEMKEGLLYSQHQFYPQIAVKKDPVTGKPITEEVPRKATREDIDDLINDHDEATLKDIAKRLGIRGRDRAAMLADPRSHPMMREDARDYLEGTGPFEDYGPSLYENKPTLVTPESEQIVSPHRWALKATGLEDVMRDYANDIYAGKTDKSPIQYIRQKAIDLKKTRDDKEIAEANRKELTNSNYMSYVNAAPADKIFGNYAAIEFDPSMSAEELGKGLSIDSDILKHCVGSGGIENGDHFGIWDPATGKMRDGIRGPVSNEMDQIMRNGAHVASIRDTATGKPVVTVKRVPSGNGLFDLDFVSGVKNGAMDPKGIPALRDYLNSIATTIKSPGSNLVKNGVYDLKVPEHQYYVARDAGMKEQELRDYLTLHPETSRFVTTADVKAMKPQSVAVATRSAAPSATILDRIAGGREPAPTDFFDAHEIATTDTSTIPQLNAVLDDLDSNAMAYDHWTENLSEDDLHDIHSSARSNLENQVGQMVREALRIPNLSAERLTFLRDELTNPTPAGPLRHVLPGNFDDLVQEIDNEIAHLNARANTLAIPNDPDALAAYEIANNIPISEQTIDEYINDMDPGQSAHIENIIREYGEQNGWTDNRIEAVQDRDGDWDTIPWVRNAVRVELEAERANAPAVANQPLFTVSNADITHYINNMEDIDITQHLTDWAREQGIAAPDDWAIDFVNSMSPDDYNGIPSLRETVRAQLENEQLAGDWEPDPPMTLPAPAPAMADLVNELSSLTQLVRPDMDQYARTDTLTDEIIANARPHVIPFTGAETPAEIANRIARLNPDIPPTLLAYLIGRRTTAEDVFGIRGLPDPLIHEVRAHLDTIHPANVQALPPAEQAHVTQIREMIGNATEAQGLNAIRRYMDDLGAELSIDTLGTLSEELATRQQNLTQQNLTQQELNNAQAAHTPAQAALPAPTTQQVAAVRVISEGIMTAPSLDVLQQMADYIHNERTTFTNEQFREMERLLTTRAQELVSAPDAGFAKGGIVRMEDGGDVHIRPSGRDLLAVDADADLFSKYGIGITASGSIVKLPGSTIKPHDISELRARYNTDEGIQYGLSKRPREKAVSLTRTNPKEQSSWRVDMSPAYKGISYSKRFAAGGVVDYDDRHIDRLADELLGATHG
jgi:hypothetical protein